VVNATPRHATASLPPGKTRYPLYRRLGGPKGRSGRVRKILLHRDSIPDRPAHSESLYRLSYPGTIEKKTETGKDNKRVGRTDESQTKSRKRNEEVKIESGNCKSG
jgi:hypothetical protein